MQTDMYVWLVDHQSLNRSPEFGTTATRQTSTAPRLGMTLCEQPSPSSVERLPIRKSDRRFAGATPRSDNASPRRGESCTRLHKEICVALSCDCKVHETEPPYHRRGALPMARSDPPPRRHFSRARPDMVGRHCNRRAAARARAFMCSQSPTGLAKPRKACAAAHTLFAVGCTDSGSGPPCALRSVGRCCPPATPPPHPHAANPSGARLPPRGQGHDRLGASLCSGLGRRKILVERPGWT